DDWGFLETESLLNTKSWVDFYQYRHDLVKKHKVAMDPDTLKSANGEQGAYVSGKAMSILTWANPTILGREQKFEQTVIVAPWEVRKAYLVGFPSYVVNKSSKSLDDAASFAIRITTDEDILATMVKISSTHAVYNTRYIIEKYLPEKDRYFFDVEVVHNPATTSKPDLAKDAVACPSFSGRVPGFINDTLVAELE